MKDQQFKTDLAVAKKACCQKRAKVSSVRYIPFLVHHHHALDFSFHTHYSDHPFRTARLPAAACPESQEAPAALPHAFTGCFGSLASLSCD